MTTHADRNVTDRAAGRCCVPDTLWGWSPPDLPADTTAKRRVDRYLPRTGLGPVLYFAAVAALVNVAHLLGTRLDLSTLTVAGVAGGGWCTLNFWRCRHAHCLITGVGWLALAVFTAVEAGIGHSLIDGDEPLVFVAVLAAGLLFECGWAAACGSNAVGNRPSDATLAASHVTVVNVKTARGQPSSWASPIRSPSGPRM